MKIRIVSAIVFALIALPFIIVGKNLYALGIGIISLLGFLEILKLKKSHNPLPFIPCLFGVISYLLLIYVNYLPSNIASIRYFILFFSLLIPTIFYKKDIYKISDAIFLIGIILFLGTAFNSFILVRQKGIGIFIYLITIPIITDTFAYIVGSKMGKHKMIPRISPNKTWEGTIAGAIFGTIIPSIIYFIVIKDFSFMAIFITLILSCAGQIGDLIFSKIKRENDIKDFSNIIPGHGGILDRLDSTIFIFTMYILINTLI